jgi:hypothetical protein
MVQDHPAGKKKRKEGKEFKLKYADTMKSREDLTTGCDNPTWKSKPLKQPTAALALWRILVVRSCPLLSGTS